MNLTDTIHVLAAAYVADDEPGYVMTGLIRIAENNRRNAPLSVLAMQLSLASESLVDDLLCRVERLGRDDGSHDLCCEGECSCATSASSFAHPRCERCDDVIVDKRDQAVADLIACLHPRMAQYIEFLGKEAAA